MNNDLILGFGGLGDQKSPHSYPLKGRVLWYPRLHDGMCWAWLGAVHMNMNKLMMEDALLESETYLSKAHPFPGDE